MKLRIVRADPAGNITIFVLDAVPVDKRTEIAKAILAKKELAAEQVAFRTGENRIDMAGGEFCGNASRAFGMLLAHERGITGKAEFAIEISGCDEPVKVTVDTEKHEASAEMPLPKSVAGRTVGDVHGILVNLGGIAHFVTEETEPSLAFFRCAEPLFDEFPGIEAYGVIFLEKDGRRIYPLIRVPAADSLVWEGSCGSGSIACAVTRSIGIEGEYSEKYIQPVGEIRASVTRRNGKIEYAGIGGRAVLEAEREILI